MRDRIIVCVVRYGWHGGAALRAILKEDAVQRHWRAYTADYIAAITERLYRYTGASRFEAKYFSEIWKPKRPEMSARQIMQHVLDGLS